MGIEILERNNAVIAKALSTEDGRALAALLRETYVDVGLMGKTDRETVANVAKHDLVVYLTEIGSINL